MNERECKCGRPPGHFRMDITGCGDKPSTPAPASPAVPAEGAETLADRVRALADAIAQERDDMWQAYLEHNAGRAANRPRIRPDIGTWANAYEVAERRLRALLTEEPTDG